MKLKLNKRYIFRIYMPETILAIGHPSALKQETTDLLADRLKEDELPFQKGPVHLSIIVFNCDTQMAQVGKIMYSINV